MIQDILPHKFHNEYCRPEFSPEDTVFLFHEKKVLCRPSPAGHLHFPSRREFEWNIRTVYLFRIDGHCYYLGVTRGKHPFPSGYSFAPVFSLRQSAPPDRRMAAVTAWHLYVWYRDNRFCGRCGAKLTHSASERALYCSCGNLVYPKIAPAVIVGVVHGSRILMSRYAGREYRGHALLAGFCEIGETAEETVMREVMEETGIRVKNIRYYKSQPWGFDSNLLLGYFCELDGDPRITLDREELAVAEWVPRDAIQDAPDQLSLTREMILYFKDHPEAFS